MTTWSNNLYNFQCRSQVISYPIIFKYTSPFFNTVAYTCISKRAYTVHADCNSEPVLSYVIIQSDHLQEFVRPKAHDSQHPNVPYRSSPSNRRNGSECTTETSVRPTPVSHALLYPEHVTIIISDQPFNSPPDSSVAFKDKSAYHYQRYRIQRNPEAMRTK